MAANKTKPGRGPRWRRIAPTDVDTGEIMVGVPMLIGPRAQKLGTEFFMSIQRAFLSLAADREITGEAWRVLAYLLGRMDFENWLRLPQTEIARALDMPKQHVNRAIGRLVEKGIIEKSGTTIGGARLYRVSHELAWRGSVSNWKERDREKKRVEARQRARRSGLKVIEGGAGRAAKQKTERR